MSQETSMAEILSSAGLPSEFTHLIANDLKDIEEILHSGIRSETTIPSELASYLIKTGGKRLRPLLVCLTYRGLTQTPSDSNFEKTMKELHTLAAVAEWVHTATLFHDDVIDASDERRSKPSAHVVHGNKNAILVGDFVYAEAFAKLMDLGLLEASQTLAHTVKSLVEGELLQHHVSMNREISLSDYQRIALSKTGALFAWCVQTGAWLNQRSLSPEAWKLGACLGTAFQMADDFIDTFEFNPLNCRDSELQQWIEGAPPLPVVLANELNKSGEIQRMWHELAQEFSDKDTIRKQIFELLALCQKPEVKNYCLKIFSQEFLMAQEMTVTLGLRNYLAWALDIIYKRALSGLNLPENENGQLQSDFNMWVGP